VQVASKDATQTAQAHARGGTASLGAIPLLDAVAVALLLHRDDEAIAVATRPAADLLGLAPEELEGCVLGMDGPPLEAADGSALGPAELPCRKALRSGRRRSAVVRARAADGSDRWLRLESRPVAVEAGGPVALATAIVDVTAECERERELSHDQLTGLGNRSLAYEHLQRTIARADRRHAAIAVIYIDLDGFKQVNDSHGHAAGDRLLRAFAQRLRGILRAADFAGRMGGDEFLIVAGEFEPDPDRALTAAEVATEVAWSIARRIERALDTPLHAGDRSHRVQTSIGVAVYPPHGHDIESVLQSADAAMYEAKAAGRGRVRFFVPHPGAARP
jgi:diguanylate cyclase